MIFNPILQDNMTKPQNEKQYEINLYLNTRYNPNATPADKFLVLCKGDTAPTEVSVLVELDLI